MTNREMQQLAYELGQKTAFEKNAQLFSWLGQKVAPWLLSKYQAARNMFTGAVGKAGQGIVSAAGGPGTTSGKWLQVAGKGVPGQMWGFGAFGAGMGALMNPEDRLSGAARGFAGGALSGLGWGAGQNVLQRGLSNVGRKYAPEIYEPLRRAAMPKLMRGLTREEQLAQQATAKFKVNPQSLTPQEMQAQQAVPNVPGYWQRFREQVGPKGNISYAQAAKALGAKAALGAIPFAGAWYASGAVPNMVMPDQGY